MEGGGPLSIREEQSETTLGAYGGGEGGGVVVKIVAAKVIREHVFLYLIIFLYNFR